MRLRRSRRRLIRSICLRHRHRHIPLLQVHIPRPKPLASPIRALGPQSTTPRTDRLQRPARRSMQDRYWFHRPRQFKPLPSPRVIRSRQLLRRHSQSICLPPQRRSFLRWRERIPPFKMYPYRTPQAERKSTIRRTAPRHPSLRPCTAVPSISQPPRQSKQSLWLQVILNLR
jgi:hypothetical protein